MGHINTRNPGRATLFSPNNLSQIFFSLKLSKKGPSGRVSPLGFRVYHKKKRLSAFFYLRATIDEMVAWRAM